MQKIGIEGLKNLIDVVCGIKQLATSDIKQLSAEWADLDDQEKAELVAHFKQKMKLKEGKAEQFIENCFGLGLEVIKYAQKLKFLSFFVGIK